MCDDDAPANPTYEALETLKSDVDRDVYGSDDRPAVREKLDSIAERIGGGSVWNGTQATDFSADLDGQKEKLTNRADDVPDDVEEKLASTPATLDDDG